MWHKWPRTYQDKRCRLDLWVGKIPWPGNPLHYSCLENLMDRGAWQGYSPWGHKELDTTEASSHVCTVNNLLFSNPEKVCKLLEHGHLV